MAKVRRKSFAEMNKKERENAIRALMEDGHSNKTAAMELGVKPGVIAGLRWRHKIPSKNETGFKPLLKGQSGIILRLATSELTRCKAPMGEYVCRYEQEPGSDYCARPEHQALEQKRRAG